VKSQVAVTEPGGQKTREMIHHHREHVFLSILILLLWADASSNLACVLHQRTVRERGSDFAFIQ
jgi:hypothetical protein